MSLETTGFDELINKLNTLGNVGSKVGKKAVKSGLEVTLRQLKADSPKNTGKGANGISITSLKVYKGGSVWGKCGIDSSNWADTKQLWYHHFGYSNKGLKFKGMPIAIHTGWMTASFNKVKNRAGQQIEDTVLSEIKSILGS